MTNKLMIANLKMNLEKTDISNYIKKLNNHTNNKNIVICPTSIYIPYFLKQEYSVGLQNVFYEENGAYTGEISPTQAKSMGIEYVIIGHSERRKYFNETNYIINKKIKKSLDSNLKIILCVGETTKEKNFSKTKKLLKKQIVEALKGIKDLDNLIIAYEPVWAIGTNIIPTEQDIKNVIDYIKNILKDMKVLYGGSINESNVENLKQIDNVDGFLIGGSSTNIDKFLKIIDIIYE